MFTRKLLFISKLVLSLVLGYVVIGTAMIPAHIKKTLASASMPHRNNAQAIETTALPDLSLEDYAQIAERNLFGVSGQTPDAVEWALSTNSFGFDRSVSEELGLTLSGTISGNAAVARAIIKDLKTDVLGLYKIGQLIGDSRIEGIEADAVILRHKGERKILGLTTYQSGSSNNNPVSSSRTNNEKSKALETDLPSEKTDINIRTKIKCIEEVLTKAVIEPYVVDGQIEGLKITGLENINRAKEFGLKNGDVIRTVNGHLLTSKQKAYQVFKKARSQAAISLELLRDDKIRRLSFALR